MSVRDKVLARIAVKSRLITGVAFLVSLYFFTVLPSLGSRASVEEDTMATGATYPFIIEADMVYSSGTLETAIRQTGLQPFRFEIDGRVIDYTVAESKRGDSREAVVCAIVGEPKPASSLGITVAKAMAKSDWLGKDVYFVFVPQSLSPFAHGLKSWLEDFLTSVHHPVEERPLVRAAFVIEISNGPLSMVQVEGLNGINSNADMSALAMEVADELRMPLKVRSGFDAIAFSAMNGGVHAPHTAFQDKAIPSVTVTLSMENGLLAANFLGKYLRAMSSLYHQMHHSSSVFLYMGHRADVHLGILFPVIVGLTSPLYTSILLPENNNGGTTSYVVMLGYAMAAVLVVGGSSLLALLSSDSAIDCKALRIGSTDVPYFVWTVMGLLAIGHVAVSKYLAKFFSVGEFSSVLKTSAQIVYSIVLTMLFVLHWSGAVLAVAITVPLLTLVTPIRSKRRGRAVLSAVVLVMTTVAFLYLFAGIPVPPALTSPVAATVSYLRDMMKSIRSSVALPVEFLGFLHRLLIGAVSYKKDIGTLVQETVCVRGFALPITLIVIFPALVLALEITIADPPEDTIEVPASGSDAGTKKERKMIAVAIAVVGFAVAQYFSQ